MAITTDVIVGFPRETDKEFDESLEFCKEAGFARIHVFSYSPRSGTAAAKMTGQVPDKAKKERSGKMLALAEESAQRHLEYLEKAKQNALFHVAQQDVCNTGLFYQGVSEGYTLFLDERGWFCGDRGRTEIYLNLIGCMIEVEKLRHTLPQKTRPQFYDDLAQVFRLTPRAHEWFNDVCDDIKFPIKSVGAPRKSAPVA